MIRNIFSKIPIIMFTIFTILFVILAGCGKVNFDLTTGIILLICYIAAIVFDLTSDIVPETIIKRDGFTIYIKKEKGERTHAFILNSKDDPIIGISISKNEHEKTGYQYVVGFSNKEKNVYSINPENGVGKKIFGYNESSDKDV